MASWHYAIRGEQFGPVDDRTLAALLANGAVTMDALVWREGMAEWKVAREVPEVRDLIAMSPAATTASGAPQSTGTPPRAGLAPPTRPDGIVATNPGADEGDRTGGVIPYKNPMALTAYYLGIFALIPCLGIPLAIAAIVCGIIGIRRYQAKPIIRGVAHAWIGIAIGSLVLLGSTLLIVGGFVF